MHQLATEAARLAYYRGEAQGVGLAIIAFRGTEPDNLANIEVDLEASLTPRGGIVGTGSRRFRQSDASAPEQRRTGHSLGAAIATLIATLFESQWLITRGSPRVGNARFLATVRARLRVRIVNCCDLVSQVPSTIGGYVHLGSRRTSRGTASSIRPGTSIHGYLETLSVKDDTLSESERGRLAVIALRQVGRLSRLVRELFDLVRLDDARAHLTLERFTPAELLQDVVQEFCSIADGPTIVFQADEGADLAQMVGDINLIQRMIENLVTNAVNHTPRGGKISVKLASGDGQIVLEVRDTGRGIKPEHIPRIFERYERGDTAGRIPGTGLGLAIVKRIVELHSGSISVDSQLWLGTYFTVRLPIDGPSPGRPATP